MASLDGGRNLAWEAAVWGVPCLLAAAPAQAWEAAPGRDAKPGAVESEDAQACHDAEARAREAALRVAESLRDPDFQVRWDACLAIARLGRAAEPFLPSLQRLASQDHHPDVARAARRALRVLTQALRDGWPTCGRRAASPPPPHISDAEAEAELRELGLDPRRLCDWGEDAGYGARQAVRRVALHCRRLQAMDEEALLHQHSAALGLPLELGVGREETLARLARSAFRAELPVRDLSAMCAQQGLPETSGAATDPERRAELAGRLDREECARAWAARGMAPDDLGSFAAARAVVERQRQLCTATVEALRGELSAKGLPAEASAGREELEGRLCSVVLWEALPMPELERRARERGIAAPPVLDGPATQRASLVAGLLLAQTSPSLVRAGVPTTRLCSWEVATALAAELERVDALSGAALAQAVRDVGAVCPPEGAAEQRRLLRAVAVWRALPSGELAREWAESRRGAALRELGLRADIDEDVADDGQQASLLRALILVACAPAWRAQGLPTERIGSLRDCARAAEEWDRWRLSSERELREAAAAAGLLATGGLRREELELRLRRLSVWRALPLEELRREAAGARLGERMPGDDPGACLLARLAAAEGWAEDPRRSARLAALGLPPGATAEEAKRAFRRLALQHHPDKRRGGDAAEAARRFREVAEAYEALCGAEVS